jgi:hypothetical protein
VTEDYHRDFLAFRVREVATISDEHLVFFAFPIGAGDNKDIKRVREVVVRLGIVLSFVSCEGVPMERQPERG